MMDYYLSVHHEFGAVSSSLHTQELLPPPPIERENWSSGEHTGLSTTGLVNNSGLTPSGLVNNSGLTGGHHHHTIPSNVHLDSSPLSSSPTPPPASQTGEVPDYSLGPLYISASNELSSAAVFSPAAATSSYQPTYR